MRTSIRAGLSALALSFAAAASAQPGGVPLPERSCQRECLEGFVDKYLQAMADGKVDPALFAPGARFTENGIEMPLGNEGLWATTTAPGKYKLYVPDVAAARQELESEARAARALPQARGDGRGKDTAEPAYRRREGEPCRKGGANSGPRALRAAEAQYRVKLDPVRGEAALAVLRERGDARRRCPADRRSIGRSISSPSPQLRSAGATSPRRRRMPRPACDSPACRRRWRS